MSPRFVKLPGSPRVRPGPTLPVYGLRRTKRTITYHDVDDQAVIVDRALVRQRILDALRAGPLFKWELRERLHLPEDLLAKELTALREAGVVKHLGRQQLRRKWALSSYEPPEAPVYPDAETVVVSKKPAPAKDSWWTRPDLSREAFQERARRRADV